MRILIPLALLAFLPACNTVEGFGRDLARGGEAIEEAAKDAQRPAPQPVYRPAPDQPTYSQPAPNTQYVY